MKPPESLVSEVPQIITATVRLLNEAAVRERTSLSRATLWRLRQSGSFPAPLQISLNRVAWRECDVAAWIQAKAVDLQPVSTKSF